MTHGTGGSAQGERAHGHVERLVAALRVARDGARDPDRGTGDTLPSARALAGVVEAIVAALFPNHFGPPDMGTSGVDRFVRDTLERALQTLLDQVCRELRWTARRGSLDGGGIDEHAGGIVRQFAASLPGVRSRLESDVNAAYRGDPAAKSIDEVLICYPGVKAIMHHRLAHALYELGTPLIARLIAEVAHSATGVDIHPGARIGGSFFIDHGTGVVIGETAVIGDRVRLYQAVTLGAKRFEVDEDGALVKGTPRHPIVEDDVVIYAGATILGRITIGRGSTIGGNVWVTRSVAPGSHLTQALARIEVFDAGSGI
ncbi:MAG: serine acetyltransferase [Acidobacteria bacterium]|nr:serine acetyltransferase [Acidobacteriota bacterium]